MKQWKIAILDGKRLFFDSTELDSFCSLGELSFFPSTTEEEIVTHISNSEIILVDEVPITRKIIESCPSIKLVGLFSTGYDHVDIEAAHEHGILVCNVPKYSSCAVAQLTTALLLEICNNVGVFNSDLHAGIWQDMSNYTKHGIRNMVVAGKTIGIVGYGCIGQKFGQIMKAMGAKLLVYSRHPNHELEDNNTLFVDIDNLFANADIISLHCPLNKDSLGLINCSTIAKMKKGVILLNTARGAIINEHDVADALNSGKIGAFGQDGFENEPLPKSSPLLSTPNTFLTPHIGWDTIETRKTLLMTARENVRQFIEGTPQNVVGVI